MIDATEASGISVKFQVCEPLSTEEREALKSSIAEHGVRVPIEVDNDGNILDGHNRFEIAMELGKPCPMTVKGDMETDDQKRAYARELNCARRQMDTEKKKKIAADQLREDPRMSDRRIGRMVGLDHKTVADVRSGLETGGEIPHQETVIGEDGVEQPAAKEKKRKHEWMHTADWQDWHKLEAMSYLKAMDEETKRVADEIMAGRQRLAKDALRMLEAMSGFSEKDRARLKELWDSKEERRRSIAIAKLTGCAPLPDPRTAIVFSVLGGLDQAVAATREASEVVPLARATAEVKSFLGLIKNNEEAW